MPKFMLQASYTTAGAKGVIKEGGSSRRKTVEQMIQKLGGRMESFYFAFGDADAYVIADLPDTVTATALSMVVNSSGGATLRTIPLIDPEEIDEATKKTVAYRAPGS
jgi:uncharacterized protein with GYD domain